MIERRSATLSARAHLNRNQRELLLFLAQVKDDTRNCVYVLRFASNCCFLSYFAIRFAIRPTQLILVEFFFYYDMTLWDTVQCILYVHLLFFIFRSTDTEQLTDVLHARESCAWTFWHWIRTNGANNKMHSHAPLIDGAQFALFHFHVDSALKWISHICIWKSSKFRWKSKWWFTINHHQLAKCQWTAENAQLYSGSNRLPDCVDARWMSSFHEGCRATSNSTVQMNSRRCALNTWISEEEDSWCVLV